MTMYLRQSTADDVLIGPFVDILDGAAAETGETPTVKLSKNGQTLAAKNDVTVPVHDADGYYNCEFDATDTGTVGTLTLTVAASATALPVRHEFQVITQDAYDFMFASDAAPDAQVAALATASALTTVDTVVDGIQTDLSNGTDGLGALKIAIEAVMTTQMTESYAANGVAPTPTEAIMAIHQMLMDHSISGATWTIEKLNGTTAFIVTLNDATTPTGANRA